MGKVVVAVARELATVGETQQLLEEIWIGAQTEGLQRKVTEEKKQLRSHFSKALRSDRQHGAAAS